jgi:short-subunit dehydrogenase
MVSKSKRRLRRASPKALLVRFSYRSPRTPARVVRLLRAPSLTDCVAGRVVLITGSSSGIGRAVAVRLGAAGATLVLVARTTSALEAVKAEIAAAGGTAHVHPCDLRDRDAVGRLAAEVLERYDGVDVLINNAGRSIRRPIDESYDRLHDYERCMRLNYFAPTQLTLALLPTMRDRRRGQIINVSTMGVQTSQSRFSAYIASKAALDAFSRSLAIEAHADGVRVTTVHPPLVHTPMSAASRYFENKPGLTADEAADMVAEAITTKPTRLAPRLGVAFERARQLAPTALQAAQSHRYRRSQATKRPDPALNGARGTSGEPREFVRIEAQSNLACARDANARSLAGAPGTSTGRLP